MSLQQAGKPITADNVNRQYTLADASNTVVTTATVANLSTAYPIPGSDASQFTSYRLTCWGTAVWGSTAQKLTLSMALAGVTIGTTPAIAAAAFSVNAVINWKLIFELMCVSTGTSGTWSGNLDGKFSSTASPLLPGTAATNSVALVGVTGTDVTQDSTIANTMAIQAIWGSVTGAPSITCTNTKWERNAV